MSSTPAAVPPRGGSWRLARATAPLARRFAGRRLFPIWAVVHHVGRRTGRQLTVPVAVVPTADGFLITLPWGAGTNWARNVVAAGGATLRWKGRDVLVDRARIVGPEVARRSFSRPLWWVQQRLFGADAFLELHRV